jgi:hypothetical protein
MKNTNKIQQDAERLVLIMLAISTVLSIATIILSGIT